MPRRDAYPAALGRGRQAPYAPPPTTPPTRTFQLEGGVDRAVNSQLGVRVRRDDLVTFQVDGTHGSAVAGLQDCRTQARVNTPRPVWNPDVKQPIDFFDASWQEVPDTQAYDNGFKVQWEHVHSPCRRGRAVQWTLPEGAKGVQLVEPALQSWRERRWIDVPPLPA